MDCSGAKRLAQRCESNVFGASLLNAAAQPIDVAMKYEAKTSNRSRHSAAYCASLPVPLCSIASTSRDCYRGLARPGFEGIVGSIHLLGSAPVSTSAIPVRIFPSRPPADEILGYLFSALLAAWGFSLFFSLFSARTFHCFPTVTSRVWMNSAPPSTPIKTESIDNPQGMG